MPASNRLAPVLAALAIALVGAAAAGAKTVPLKSPPPMVFFAYVKSVTQTVSGWQITVDPAWFLTGLTAEKAAAAKGETMDGDYYIANPDHATLVFKVDASAKITVVTNGTSGPVKSTFVPVAELAQVVSGKAPASLGLVSRDLGYWITVRNGDTAVTLDQQYVQ